MLTCSCKRATHQVLVENRIVITDGEEALIQMTFNVTAEVLLLM